MTTLEDLVPSLDLCQQVHEKYPEAFRDSALIHIESYPWDAKIVTPRDVLCKDYRDKFIAPAPTLSEILDAIAAYDPDRDAQVTQSKGGAGVAWRWWNSGEYTTVTVFDDDEDYTVLGFEEYYEFDSKAVDVALSLWLKIADRERRMKEKKIRTGGVK